MDFSLILFIALVVTGAVTLAWRLFAGRRRRRTAPPVLVEYARALFPVVLIVFVLRSFIVEPFRIPSGSMLPSLHVGDFILVNKFRYGLRLPILHRKVLEVDAPARGDVMVFRYPNDPELNFIKRVVGLPGDVLSYVDKELAVNGVPAETRAEGDFDFTQDSGSRRTAQRFTEVLDASRHAILKDPARGSRDLPRVTVPAGHYFVLGDNRDHSNDSRYWSFVPEENVVGKAFFIWFSWQRGGGVAWNRIGSFID